MKTSEIEYNLLSIGEPKLHDAMCKRLCAVYVKISALFPDLEAARPRSTCGIQALCSLHIALEKTKNILRHCAECSKLYLAITGDSVVLKFEKARCDLVDSLTRVEDIVPQTIGHQIAEIIGELAKIEFSLDPVDKKIGGDIILLFQQRRNFNIKKDELESFHEAACKLGIASSQASLRETRALKKLIERAHADEDKKKESIIAFLLHLIRKYSKSFKSEFSDDNDSQGSTPCSPTIINAIGQNGCAFDWKVSKLGFSNFKPNIPIPPEELRCPISLQLMYDPVIISSGQTYERVCIEKWFSDGHTTCPKTQQELSHLSLTPNYCVKGLVASWCEQNGVSVQDRPHLNYGRLALSESDSANSKSIGSTGSCKFIEEEIVSAHRYDCHEVSAFERYEYFLTVLEEDDMMKKCKVVEQIRHLLKDDDEFRAYMGANGFVQPLLWFLESAVFARNGKAQETGAMALFNLAVNNNRNKELMLASGVLPILQKMIANTDSVKSATALYMNLSLLEEAKPVIGNSEVVSFLISVLNHEDDVQCKLDALHTLYNISTYPPNTPQLLSSGIINALQTIIAHPDDHMTEKCIAVLINLSSNKTAIDEITTSVGLISGLAAILDVSGPLEQEHAVTCLLALCNENEKCSQVVLREGVIPSLVSISVSGSTRGRQKAQKLLMLFREQRQQRSSESIDVALSDQDSKPTCNRKVGKGLSFWLKSKSFSVYQC